MYSLVGKLSPEFGLLHFRMAQAREAEPTDWNLLKGSGEVFAAGKKVKIGQHSYRVSWPGRILRTKRSVPLLIGFFALAYAGALLLSGPWW